MLLLKPVEIDPAKPYFAWERPRQLGNSVLYLPPDDPIVAAFEKLMAQEELTPDWLALRHRLTFALRRLRGGSKRLSDIRIAIYGPAALTALARRAGETALRAAEEIVLCGACRAETLLRALGFFSADRRSRHHRPAHFAERPRQPAAGSRQPLCLGSAAVRGSGEPPGWLIYRNKLSSVRATDARNSEVSHDRA